VVVAELAADGEGGDDVSAGSAAGDDDAEMRGLGQGCGIRLEEFVRVSIWTQGPKPLFLEGLLWHA